MSEYILNWQSQGAEGIPGKSSITLAQETANSSSSSLVLTGRALENYGKIQQENFLRLLENFASSSPPSNATIGQLWFKPNSNSLYVLSSSTLLESDPEYIPIGGSTSWLRVPLDVNGTVKIGTSETSTAKLQITGGTANIRLEETGSGAKRLEFSIDGSAVARISANQSAQSIALETAGAERVRIDSNGNVGIGIVPSAWSTNGHALEFETGGLYSYPSTGSINLTNNTYYGLTGGFKYVKTAAASRYYQANGKHSWFVAPSGTAGDAVPFTEAMTLDLLGNLGVGTSSPANRLHVIAAGEQVKIQGSGNSDATISMQPSGSAVYNWIRLYSADGSTNASITSHSGSALYLTTGTNGTIHYRASGAGLHLWYCNETGAGPTEHMRLDNSGNLGIGTTTPASRLEVAGKSSTDQVPDIQITRSSSGNAIQTGPNITFKDGTTANSVALQATQGRFGVWNYGGSSWNERFAINPSGAFGLNGANYGTSGQVLTSNGSGAPPSWTSVSAPEGSTYGYVGIAGEHVASWIRFPDGFTIQAGRVQLINGLGSAGGVVGRDYGRSILFARAFSGPVTPGYSDTDPHIVMGGIFSADEATDLRFLGQAVIQQRSSTGFNIAIRWNGDSFASTIEPPPTVIVGYIAYGFS